MRNPTGSNGRSAKKIGLFFALWKMISQLSLCLPLAAVSYKRLVTTSGKKEINSLAQLTIFLRTLNEQKVSVIVAGVCCLNERFFVVSCLSTRKRKRIQNNVGNKVHLRWNTDETIWRTVIHPHLLQVDYIKDLLFPPQCSFSSLSQHSLGILSSLLPFTRNIPSTCRLNSCTVLWQ